MFGGRFTAYAKFSSSSATATGLASHAYYNSLGIARNSISWKEAVGAQMTLGTGERIDEGTAAATRTLHFPEQKKW